VLKDSNRLALFLRLKEVYYQSYAGLSKEYEDIFAYKILADKKNMRPIRQIISKQTYLYPRLHSCLHLLMNEINLYESKAQDKANVTRQFIQSILDEHFDEEVYANMKSTAKFKFLHIGFQLWQMVVKSIRSWDIQNKYRE
jgi:hypothetical protein